MFFPDSIVIYWKDWYGWECKPTGDRSGSQSGGGLVHGSTGIENGCGFLWYHSLAGMMSVVVSSLPDRYMDAIGLKRRERDPKNGSGPGPVLFPGLEV